MEWQESLNLKLGGQEYEINRNNTTFWGFAGHLACYDHVFHVMEEDPEENRAMGIYIFSHLAGYEDLVNYLSEQEYPAHINQQSVPACDVEAFERQVLGDVRSSDSFPEDWEAA